MYVCMQGEAPQFKFLYEPSISIKDKLHTIVKEMYGVSSSIGESPSRRSVISVIDSLHIHLSTQGDGVEYTPEAEEQIQAYTKAGYAHLPVCIAKTQYR